MLPCMELDRSGYELEFIDEFNGDRLDRDRWIPAHLPQWSDDTLSAARYELGNGRLRLLIESDQLPWSPEHNGGLRVSNLQTGVFSGPLGSELGQHHFTEELRVRQAQAEKRLYTPLYGIVEARVAAIADPDCMVALWMIGFEDHPDRSAEICIFEIFGRDVTADGALVGMGLHPFGDRRIRDEFVKIPVDIDVRDFHTYSVEWLPGAVRFYIDDRAVATMQQSPDYPVQLMLSIYEFAPGEPADYPKEFLVDWVRGYRQVTEMHALRTDLHEGG
jgi:hypothetical protein